MQHCHLSPHLVMAIEKKTQKRGYIFTFRCISWYFSILKTSHLIIFPIYDRFQLIIVVFQTSYWFLSHSNRFLKCLSGHICQLHCSDFSSSYSDLRPLSSSDNGPALLYISDHSASNTFAFQGSVEVKVIRRTKFPLMFIRISSSVYLIALIDLMKSFIAVEVQCVMWSRLISDLWH